MFSTMMILCTMHHTPVGTFSIKAPTDNYAENIVHNEVNVKTWTLQLLRNHANAAIPHHWNCNLCISSRFQLPCLFTSLFAYLQPYIFAPSHRSIRASSVHLRQFLYCSCINFHRFLGFPGFTGSTSILLILYIWYRISGVGVGTCNSDERNGLDREWGVHS